MRKINIIQTLILAGLFFVFNSCKDDNIIDNPDKTYSNSASFKIEEGIARGEMLIVDAYHIIQLAIDEQELLQSSAIITKEKLDPNQTTTYPMVITVDFGGDTLSYFQNRFRKGSIRAEISSYWKDSLSNIDIELNNYYIATKTPYYDGSEKKYFIAEAASNMNIKFQNKGKTSWDNDKLMTIHSTIDTATIYTTLGSITYNSVSRTSYYTQGLETLDYLDDKTRNIIIGSGTASDGKNTWTWFARNPNSSEEGLPYYAYNRDCPWIKSGDLILDYQITSTQKRKSIINFGPSNQSSCENNANFTQGGVNIVISLP